MPTGEHDHQKGQPGFAEAALFGLCPRCSSRTLFGGVARFAPRCRVCSLDFSKFDVGDGPAAFLILIVGSLVVGLAAWLQVSVSPPFWVHALLWIPLSSILVILGLRAAKAALVLAEYRNSSGEAGRRE
ncbi:DUF983 domain-containing protein [Altererythrobacter confluentis]|uniref:DUF983 domain-containing protein n=1 Tax=Allopontixanthobacter confluentis TaxID=1849021 RepID=A0A6L7GCL8_9SPHN|nr:DUF983 domain-containing protein [Allopontixanthobacter confluentis]MXP13713.1 DUF983 domain-containing protein [Allopontixanthobacter confluentis]